MYRFVVSVLVLVSTLAHEAFAASEPAPQKFLAAFATPDGGLASVSPDGRHVAYAVSEKGEGAVCVLDVESWELRFRASVGVETKSERANSTHVVDPVRVTFLRWVDNDRIVVATSYHNFLLLNVRAKTGQHIIDPTGTVVLNSSSGSSLSVEVRGQREGRIVALNAGSPPQVFIELTHPSPDFDYQGRVHKLWRINLDSGQGEVVHGEAILGRLLYDPTGRVRGRAHAPTMIRDSFFLHRPERSGKDRWQPLGEAYPIAVSPLHPLKPEHFFGERSFPVGFDVDPRIAYFASNIGRDTYGIYGLDLETGKRTALAIENPTADLVQSSSSARDELLVTEPPSGKVVGFRLQGIKATTHWIDPELQALQSSLEKRAPNHTVRILDWDRARRVFTVQVQQRGDAGGVFLYSATTQKMRRIRALIGAHAALPKLETSAWTISGPDGRTLSGWLVLPPTPAKEPRAVVVHLPADEWQRSSAEFNPAVFALAQMGFAVLEVNHRGVQGHGCDHWLAGRERLAQVTAEDVLAALDALPASAGIDRQRVALFGENFGGHQALRIAQLAPERIACVVGLEPLVDLEDWLHVRHPNSTTLEFRRDMRQWFFGQDDKQLKAASAGSHAKALRAQVLLIANPDEGYERYSIDQPYWPGQKRLQRTLAAAGLSGPLITINNAARYPGVENARLWTTIEAFLTEKLRAPVTAQMKAAQVPDSAEPKRAAASGQNSQR